MHLALLLGPQRARNLLCNRQRFLCAYRSSPCDHVSATSCGTLSWQAACYGAVCVSTGTVLPIQSIFILSYLAARLRQAASHKVAPGSTWTDTCDSQQKDLPSAMASALLHCALTGRPVIAQPAVFQRNTARRVQVCARQRPMIWYPNSEPPEHLDGSTPGDFG